MIISVGDRIRMTRTFTQHDYDRFAALSGDDNPIHVDPAFAATTRFGRTLCHGMLLFSTLSVALTSAFAELGPKIVDQELMFSGPTYTGEEMTILLEVTAVAGDHGGAEISTTIMRPDGSPSLLGKSLVAFERKDGVS
jgi:3-hydroxybutyryl-CoA dehydratase